MGGALLEVRGELVLKGARRLSDYANHPDPLLDLEEAAIRVHRTTGPDEWEEVQGLAVSRDHVAVLVPQAGENDPGPDQRLVTSHRDVRVKLLCPSVEVTGFLKVPLQSTVRSYIQTTRGRFLAVTQARIMAGPAGMRPGDLEGTCEFCLVNRGQLIACTETRPHTRG